MKMKSAILFLPLAPLAALAATINAVNKFSCGANPAERDWLGWARRIFELQSRPPKGQRMTLPLHPSRVITHGCWFAFALGFLSTLNPQLSTVFAQGSLTPPGAPAPTFKTLQQIEPRTPISAIPITLNNSGSYYLTTNLTQTNSASGITISANDVTIDLNGFALIGTNSTAAGITRGGFSRTNIRIRNGTVRNWANGVNMTGGGLVRLEQLTVSSNSRDGVTATGPALIADCSFTENGGHGIDVFGGNAVVRDCLVLNNGLDGIRVSLNSLVVGNFCSGNATSGSTNAAIRATGNFNRIENNHVSFYESGLVISGFPNFIFRNTTGNVGTNYIFAAGNSFGPIGTSSGVVTNHPWANFDQ